MTDEYDYAYLCIITSDSQVYRVHDSEIQYTYNIRYR